jgi:hypothetical protein
MWDDLQGKPTNQQGAHPITPRFVDQPLVALQISEKTTNSWWFQTWLGYFP